MSSPTIAPPSTASHLTSFKDGFVSGLTVVGEGIKTAAIATKDFAVFAGHKIKLGFSDHLIPALQKIWAGISFAALKVAHFARTPLGIGSAIVLTGLALSSASAYFMPKLKDADGNFILDKKNKLKDEYPNLRMLMDLTAAAITIFGLGFIVHYGGNSGFLTKVI